MLLIFVPHITQRIEYLFNFVFKDYLKIDFTLTTNKKTFLQSAQSKINYSKQPFEEELFFYATPILFENTITKQHFKVATHQQLPAFFHHQHTASSLPFDPFALIFYLLTRYEEYTSHIRNRDQHNRFPARESIAYQHNFLHLPIIDLWLIEIQKIISEYYPNLLFSKKRYYYLPTYDVDIAWSYRYKGIFRTIGGYFRDISTKNFKNLLQRVRVQVGWQKDPYQTFEYLDKLHSEYRLSPIYFFLVGTFGSYDKNISISVSVFQQLLRQISSKYAFGIHPSYKSNESVDILSKERSNLLKVIKKPIYKSRQHFLRLHLPITYQNLITIGIKEEYTMGYSEAIGFRAGTSMPFTWFDLEKNVATTLKVVPFQVMDVTLKNYLKLSPKQAVEEVKKIIAVTKAVGGQFVTLWHNNSLSETDGWENWRTVYEEIVKAALE